MKIRRLWYARLCSHVRRAVAAPVANTLSRHDVDMACFGLE